MAFDQRQGIPATFFVGVSKGKGLSYSVANARTWIIHLLHNGFDVGVHGIAYDNFELMQREYRTFKAISGLDMFGIRMHYLRKNADTLQILEKIGYLFDSSVYEITGPKTIGQTWEFPLHIMDTRILYQGMTQPVSFAEARRRTTGIIQQVMALNLPYLTVLFHDHYYCDSYPLWQDWYEWLIKYLKDLGVSFCDYREAMREIR